MVIICLSEDTCTKHSISGHVWNLICKVIQNYLWAEPIKWDITTSLSIPWTTLLTPESLNIQEYKARPSGDACAKY